MIHTKTRLQMLLLLVTMLVTTLVTGQSLAQASDAAVKAIRGKIQQARPDFKLSSIQPSPVEGIYEVRVGGGPILYATADGDYFFSGDLFAVEVGGIVNLAELERDKGRKVLIDGVATDDMIVFSPEGKTKAYITVFTDVDCFYCQKLHKEVPAMNAKGIEVRYLAYPRAGIGSESYKKIASAWCADDSRKAITMLKQKEKIPENVCDGNPVAAQYAIGQQVGVRGTPALVLESGQLVPGYRSAADMASLLKVD